MPYVTETRRQYPYYVDVEATPGPTQEELERGKKIADGIRKLWQGLMMMEVEDQNFDINWSSLNDFRLLVSPEFPIEREIIRGDPFHEHTSPHEQSSSTTSLVIDYFKLVKPKPSEQLFVPFIEGRSPRYDGVNIPLVEVSIFEPSAHELALRKR